MRFIPTRIHGMLDYLIGGLLLIAPFLLGFYRGGAESIVPMALGVMVIVYSLFTDYELGVARAISMPAHLMLDFFGGAFLALSPWIFGFSDYIAWPHVTVGILEMGAALFTRTVRDTAPENFPQYRERKV